MNVYDAAHQLENAIKESEEYKQMKTISATVESNPDLKKMIDDFHLKQVELQAKQMAGEELGPELMASAQELQRIIMQNPVAGEYMQCEMRFGLMIQDVYKIIGETVDFMKPATGGIL